MLARRMFLLGAAGALASCGTETTQLVEADVSQTMRVVYVDVYASSFNKIRGREIDVVPEQVVADVKAAVTVALSEQRGQRPVIVQVPVNDMQLVSMGQSYVFGGSSWLRGKIRVVDARTGEEVIPLTDIKAAKSDFAIGGLIGALTTEAVDEDYMATVAAFAQNIKTRMFGVDEN
jgi:hypothetical protein